jgi:hypothetical protein
LVSGWVNGGDGGIDNRIIGSDFSESNELANKRARVVVILQAGSDSLNGNVQLLSLEVGVNNIVPACGKLLKV